MTVKEKLVELIKDFQCPNYGECPYENSGCSLCQADHLIANGVTVQIKKDKPQTDLSGKCGGCLHSEPYEPGKSYYVRCKNSEHLSKPMYRERPLKAVRHRTTKACKRYVPKEELTDDVR